MVADDRGQLLLLGGLAMAIVFLAAIPLSNSLVVTESAATSDTVRKIDQTADREAAAERAILTIANRTDSTDEFNRTLQNYSAYRLRVSGQQSGVYVNATMNATASEKSVTDRSDFREPVTNDNQRWRLLNDSRELSELNITVDDASGQPSGNSAFRVIVSNSSGDEWQLRIADPAPPGGDVDVDVRAPGGRGPTRVPHRRRLASTFPVGRVRAVAYSRRPTRRHLPVRTTSVSHVATGSPVSTISQAAASSTATSGGRSGRHTST